MSSARARQILSSRAGRTCPAGARYLAENSRLTAAEVIATIDGFYAFPLLVIPGGLSEGSPRGEPTDHPPVAA
jgi:hypothetical protein